MFRFVTSITLVILIFACQTNRQQEETATSTDTDTISRTESKFYKKFIGKIGDLDVSMDLYKDDTLFQGSYYYDKVGILLNITGSYNGGNGIILEETDDEGSSTGRFEISITDDGVITGYWTSPDKRKKLPVSLTAAGTDYAQITIEDKYSENCERTKSAANKPEGEQSSFDTMCSTLKLRLVRVKVASEAATKKINNTITDKLCGYNSEGHTPCSVNDLLNSVFGDGGIDGFEREIACFVLTNEKNVLSISIDDNHYLFGAAHPTYGTWHLNFDPRTGAVISLEELFKPDASDELITVLVKNFTLQNGEDDWWLTEEDGVTNSLLTDNFSIHPGGLTFHYNPYEIGPYAMGAPSVFIPYREISHLINPNSVIAPWSKRQ
ncbi:MAG: RsiV family protein [Chitinophagales bacterium]|nr:RsiV family protein [Chitinophagales bacterium]MDW8418854.1 RsiV family protein [Chitinophagales bacterium]